MWLHFLCPNSSKSFCIFFEFHWNTWTSLIIVWLINQDEGSGSTSAQFGSLISLDFLPTSAFCGFWWGFRSFSVWNYYFEILRVLLKIACTLIRQMCLHLLTLLGKNSASSKAFAILLQNISFKNVAGTQLLLNIDLEIVKLVMKWAISREMAICF